MTTKQHTRSTKRTRTTGSSRAKAQPEAGPSPGPRRHDRRPRSVPGVRQAFDGHGHDAWGLVAIVTGVVAGLGIYSHLAGPVGQALADGIGAVVGVVSWLVPPALIALGVLLVRGPRTEEEPPSFVRPLVGAGLVLMAACAVCSTWCGGARPGATRWTTSPTPAAPSARSWAAPWPASSGCGEPDLVLVGRRRAGPAGGDQDVGAGRRRVARRRA